MKKNIDFIKKIDWSSVSLSVYVRYILMLISIVNTLLTRFGLNPITVSEDALYQQISDFVSIALLIVNTWKNNSVTKEAIEADKYLNQLKTPTDDPEVSDDEVNG